LISKILLLPRKGHLGEKLKKEIAVVLIFALMLLGLKKPISYHQDLDKLEKVRELTDCYRVI
jgi:hypothetical protein